MGEDDNILSLPGQIEADMDAAVGGAGGAGLDPWDEAAFMTQYFGPATTELRLRPSTGRTIHIKGAVDVARGFSLLQRAVGHNRVRRDLNAQRFHERPALKRKRLLRERWRERFKTGFRAVVSRAMELKAQGW
jgi:small subunit ribosomal protein MRP21